MSDTIASIENDVEVIVVHYQTPDLLRVAVESFKRHYPHVPLLIVDNGSMDGSHQLIESLARSLPSVSVARLDSNLYHGPAMDWALQHIERPYAFLLDSDTETFQGGFLEPMVALLEKDPAAYGAGLVVTVNDRGFARPAGIPVLSSAHMILKTDLYRGLPPFIHHGLPALQNFRTAHERGLRLLPWPIEDFVRHLGRGTAARYGYGLGLRAKLDYILSRIGI